MLLGERVCEREGGGRERGEKVERGGGGWWGRQRKRTRQVDSHADKQADITEEDRHAEVLGSERKGERANERKR